MLASFELGASLVLCWRLAQVLAGSCRGAGSPGNLLDWPKLRGKPMMLLYPMPATVKISLYPQMLLACGAVLGVPGATMPAARWATREMPARGCIQEEECTN